MGFEWFVCTLVQTAPICGPGLAVYREVAQKKCHCQLLFAECGIVSTELLERFNVYFAFNIDKSWEVMRPGELSIRIGRGGFRSSWWKRFRAEYFGLERSMEFTWIHHVCVTEIVDLHCKVQPFHGPAILPPCETSLMLPFGRETVLIDTFDTLGRTLKLHPFCNCGGVCFSTSVNLDLGSSLSFLVTLTIPTMPINLWIVMLNAESLRYGVVIPLIGLRYIERHLASGKSGDPYGSLDLMTSYIFVYAFQSQGLKLLCALYWKRYSNMLTIHTITSHPAKLFKVVSW